MLSSLRKKAHRHWYLGTERHRRLNDATLPSAKFSRKSFKHEDVAANHYIPKEEHFTSLCSM